MSRNWTQEEFGITEDTEVSDTEKENRLLQEQLKVAIEALEKYADETNWCDCEVDTSQFFNDEEYLEDSCYYENGYKQAQEALAKIRRLSDGKICLQNTSIC